MMRDLATPHVPRWPYLGGNLTSAVGSDVLMTFNGTGDKVAFLWQATSTTPPDKAQFCVHSYTSGGSVDVTLEPLPSNAPTGTPVSGTNTVTISVTGTGLQTASGLAGSGSLSVGTYYAVVITAASGFAGSFTVRLTVGSGTGAISMASALSKDSAGGWSGESVSGSGTCCGLFFTGDVPLVTQNFAGAFTTLALQSFSDSTNPDERGMLWQYPMAIRVAGCVPLLGYGSGYDANEDWRAGIYLDPLGSPSREGQAYGGSVGNRSTTNAKWVLWEEGGIVVPANTPFGIAVKAVGSASVVMPRWVYGSALSMQPLVGATGGCSITRNGDSGAFTDDDTMAYGAVPIIVGVEDGAAGARYALGI